MSGISNLSLQQVNPNPVKPSTTPENGGGSDGVQGNNTGGTNGVQGNNGGNNAEKTVSIFAKLDVNKNNNVEKTEAKNSLQQGFKDTSGSIFNNLMTQTAGLTIEDKAVLQSKASELKGKVSLQALYNKAADSFSGIKLSKTEVSESEATAAQQKIDENVSNELQKSIQQFNSQAINEYTSQMKIIISQTGEQIQQYRMENTYSSMDSGKDHSINAQEAESYGMSGNGVLNDLFTKIDSSNPNAASLNMKNYIKDAMGSFQEVEAKETRQDTIQTFEQRVSQDVKTNLNSVKNIAFTNFNNDLQKLEEKQNSDNLEQININNQEKYNETRSQLQELGARFTKVEINNQSITRAIYKNDSGEIENVAINKDGSTQKLTQKEESSEYTTEQIKEAVSAKIDELLENDNARLVGNNTVTYTDNSHRNHQATVYDALDGNGNVQYTDSIISSENKEALKDAYDAVLKKFNIPRATLEDLEITPRVNDFSISFYAKNGNEISSEELLKLINQGKHS